MTTLYHPVSPTRMNPHRIITPALSEIVHDAIRTCCLVGTEPFLRRVVPVLDRCGMSVERLSVTPSTRRPDDLKARLAAQDVQDSLLLPLKVMAGVAPEVVQNDDNYKYLFVGWTGPSDWRIDLNKAGLSGAKHILSAPVTTTGDAQFLSELRCGTRGALRHGGEYSMMWNELRFAPGILALQQVLQQLTTPGKGKGERTAEVRLKLHLSPPLFGAPTRAEREHFSWWHMRQRGGGALGAAGVQAFDLLQFLLTPLLATAVSSSSATPSFARPSRVKQTRAHVLTNEQTTTKDLFQIDQRPITTSGDVCFIQCEYDALNVKVDLELDWSLRNGKEEYNPRIEVYTTDAATASASLDLVTGECVDGDMVVTTGTSLSTEGAYEDSQKHFVRALVELQAETGKAGGRNEESIELDIHKYGVNWTDALVSYNAVDASYVSWDRHRNEGKEEEDCWVCV